MRKEFLAVASVLTLLGASAAQAQTTVIERDAPSKVIVDRPASESTTVEKRETSDGCSSKTVTKENDLGDSGRLPAKIVHQVSDVFISHAHMDHIGGFLWFLRSRLGETRTCRFYGPPGLAGHIAAFIGGIRWDRIGERGPRFEILELQGLLLSLGPKKT